KLSRPAQRSSRVPPVVLGPRVLEDPGVGLIDHLGQDEQVVTTEAVGRFPLVAILVDAGDGDVEPGAVLGPVLPDGGLHGTDTDFMNWLYGILLRHGGLLV